MTPADLKHQRNELGLSQAALASLLGVRRSTVSDWERGQQAMPYMLTLAMEALQARLKSDVHQRKLQALKERRVAIAKEYLESDMTSREVAEKYGISNTVVLSYARREFGRTKSHIYKQG